MNWYYIFEILPITNLVHIGKVQLFQVEAR